MAFHRSRRSRLGTSVTVSDKKLDGVHVQVCDLRFHYFLTADDTAKMETFASGQEDSPTVVAKPLNFDSEAQMEYKKSSADYYNGA